MPRPEAAGGGREHRHLPAQCLGHGSTGTPPPPREGVRKAAARESKNSAPLEGNTGSLPSYDTLFPINNTTEDVFVACTVDLA